jgi:hypothetical protein
MFVLKRKLTLEQYEKYKYLNKYDHIMMNPYFTETWMNYIKKEDRKDMEDYFDIVTPGLWQLVRCKWPTKEMIDNFECPSIFDL